MKSKGIADISEFVKKPSFCASNPGFGAKFNLIGISDYGELDLGLSPRFLWSIESFYIEYLCPPQ
jgi:hypothetical protein